MNAQLQVQEPDDIIFTASFTMTLKDWKQLRDQLSNGVWPACDFRQSIRDMISLAEKTFYPHADNPETGNQ
jgi:hypothetical protein